MRTASSRRRSAGISLIEALVALAVMGFGTLSVLGVQGSLRLNAEIARQRSEALRIAQLAIEDTRRTHTLADFDDLADSGPDVVASESGETSYTRRIDIEPAPLAADATEGERARYKSASVVVEWTDRSGALQSISLNTTVHAAPPALAGSLAIPPAALATRMPRGRHRAIPLEAVDQGDGSSLFTPPGAPEGVRWRFDNLTGLITRLCDACEVTSAKLLAGYLRYALTTAAPTGADAEVPPSPAVAVGVRVLLTAPPSTPDPNCYSQAAAGHVIYHCAIEVRESVGWSGRSELVATESWLISAGNEADRYRVCRYTRLRGDPPLPSTNNLDHPDTYADVMTPLVNQNFLVIRAGSGIAGSAAFACPGDDLSTPLVNGQTWLHQP